MIIFVQKRIGWYAWGGPGTIRLLQTKYFHPSIDEKSFLEMYTLEYLTRAKELFGVTDAWVTFSWGFADETEKEDRHFLISQLKNFHELGIRVHAYVQGLNVVEKEFINQDIFCVDPSGHRLPYSKGRVFTCPNNPQAQKIILDRVADACKEDVDGIYVDNVLFGLPPLYVSKNFTSWFGCACECCRKKFFALCGYELPASGFDAVTLEDFKKFRAQSVEEVMKKIFAITSAHKKELGINLYDPCLLNSEIYFGYDLDSLAPYLSYFLIENYRHPSVIKEGNAHLQTLFKKYPTTPTFVLSYKKQLGCHEQFVAEDIDEVCSESENLGYSPCIKATEFTTNAIWHPLRLDSLRAPKIFASETFAALATHTKSENVFLRNFVRLFQPYYARILRYIFEHERAHHFIMQNPFFLKQLQTEK